MSFGDFLEFLSRKFLEFWDIFDFSIVISCFLEFFLKFSINPLNKDFILALSKDKFSENLSFVRRKSLSFENFWLSFGKA